MKRTSIIAMLLVSVLLLTSCAPTAFSQVKVGKYLTLGEYKGLADKERSAEVTEFDIEAEINTAMSELGYGEEQYNTQEGGTVAINDILNIDYKGMKDGVAFDGGTAEGASLTIGSNTFIPGFESQLVGVEVGKTVEIELTFPSEYGSAELAGKDVVFIVTVNSITGKVVYPALTDAIAKEIDEEVSTVEELRTKFRTTLEEERAAEVESLRKNNLWDQVIAGSEFKKDVPTSLAKMLKGEYDSYYLAVAKQYGYDTIDELLSASSIEYSDYSEGRELYCTEQGQSMLIAYAIADAEGYSVPDDVFDEKAEKMASAAGYSNVTTYVNAIGRDRLYDQFIQEFAVETVVENAIIK